MMNHKFYFSSLPGLPKKVKWPVQCVKKIHKDVVVYCKSDDAFFSVNSSQLVEFPNSGLTRLCLGAGVVRCYDAIRHIACGAGLELPNLVKSTNMRKYMATMVQCLDTTESERNWIVRHLGHNMNVHMTHYQQTSDLIERVDIAKLLLIQDTNRVKDFFGKKLEDIQFEEILTCSEDTPAEDIITGDIIPDIFDFEVDKDDITERKSKGKTSTRQKWLSDEEQELQRLFKTNFLTLKCPNNKEVQNAQRKSLLNKGLIHKRSLETIKKKMSNTLLKLKRS